MARGVVCRKSPNSESGCHRRVFAAPLVSVFPSRILQRYNDEVSQKVAEMELQGASRAEVMAFVDIQLARIAKEVVRGDGV